MEGGLEKKDPFDLALRVSQVEEWEETTDQAVKLAERDRDYYDNKQLTAEELKMLSDRGQPDVIFNKIRSKVNYLIGMEINSRTDPKGMPRTPADEGAAEACTDALRYVEDDTMLDRKFTAVWENILVEGYGGIELTVDSETGDIDAVEWPWDRLFYDPHSRKPDFSDARFLGGVVWMDADQAKTEYPDAHEAIDATTTDDTGKAHDDRPKWKVWATGSRRKRVKIVQMYYLHEGQWHWCHFTKGGKLTGGPVPFKDKRGMSWCPLFMQSAYVDRDNNRYGEVRSMISPQDEVNKRRSKALHLLTMRQTKGERGAVEDIDLMKQELAKPDGHVEINPGFDFELLDTTAQTQGNFELLQQAIAHMQTEGPNAALMGKQWDAPSGKAILANQSGGQIEVTPLVDKMMSLKLRVFRGIWNLIRQYKTAEWWVRVTDNEDNLRFVGFNRPVTFREEAAKRLEQHGVPPEQAQAMIAEMEMDPVRGPMLDQVVRMDNVPAEMDMDITIEQVPDVANVQEEQFQALTSLAPAVVFPPEVYIKASTLRNKQELLEVLKGAGSNPEAEAVQQAMADLSMRKGEAEIKKLEAETLKIMTEADKNDAQTGQIIMPTVVDPGSGGDQQPIQQDNSPAQQPGF